MLAILSGRVLGVKVSATEVSNALGTLVPAAQEVVVDPEVGLHVRPTLR